MDLDFPDDQPATDGLVSIVLGGTVVVCAAHRDAILDLLAPDPKK